MQLDGTEHLWALHRAGKGAVFVGGHLGQWELLGARLTADGLPVDFLVGQQTNARIDELMNDLRRAQRIGIIPRALALRKVMEALRAAKVVALLADQDARKGGVVVDFLGRPASTVKGPAMFAIRSGCPIVTFGAWRAGDSHRGIIDPPIFPDPALDEEKSVEDLTRRFSARLSELIRQHPRDYFWPHRRWKSTGG